MKVNKRPVEYFLEVAHLSSRKILVPVANRNGQKGHTEIVRSKERRRRKVGKDSLTGYSSILLLTFYCSLLTSYEIETCVVGGRIDEGRQINDHERVR